MSSFFGRRRTQLIDEQVEGVNLRERGSGEHRRPTSFQLCIQLALICACVVILFFGLAVTAMGLWGYRSQKDYFSITDSDPELTRLPFSMMVTGGFVAILGLVGVTGSIFSRTITGQTLLGVFSFVLVLVIISEVGAGAAAIKLRYNVEDVFVAAAKQSQLKYGKSETVTDSWDKFQRDHECCGAMGYEDNIPPYYRVFKNESVPMSCCIKQENCEEYSSNATLYKQHLFEKGCPSTVLGTLTKNLIVIAIITLVIGCTQLLAVLLAVVVAYMSSKLDREKVAYSYKKLLQQEENSQPIPS